MATITTGGGVRGAIIIGGTVGSVYHTSGNVGSLESGVSDSIRPREVAVVVDATRAIVRGTEPEFQSGAPTQVGADLAASWRIKNVVGQDRSLSWRIKNVVAQTRALSWRIRNVVSASRSLSWKLHGLVTQTRALSWRIRNVVGQDRSLSWAITNVLHVAANLVLSWLLNYQAPHGERRGPTINPYMFYKRRVQVGADLEMSWRIKRRSSVLMRSSWRIRRSVRSDVRTQWRIHQTVERLIEMAWLRGHPLYDTSEYAEAVDAILVSMAMED